METVRQFLARRALWPLWAGLAALIIVLPGLGRYGFWEPQEISVADVAKKRLERYSLTEITAAVAGQYKVRPSDLSSTVPSATDLTRARQITAYLARTYTREPDFEIIQAAGLADAAALEAAVDAVDDTTAADYQAIVTRLEQVRDKRLESEKQTRPDFTERAIAAGMRWRQDELGARLPLALLGLLALAATFYLAWRLGGARAGLLASLILLTMPLFLLQSRQLTSSIGGLTGSTLLMAGVAGLCWPADGRARHRVWLYAVDGALVVLGTLLAFDAAGALLGLVPVAAAAAVACTMALVADRGEGQGNWRLVHLLIGGALAAVALTALLVWVLSSTFDFSDPRTGAAGIFPDTDYVAALGGIWNPKPNLERNFDSLFEQIGFGGFPWVALAPVALAHLAMGGRRGRRAWAGYLMFAWAGVAWAIGAVMQRKVGPVHYPAMAALAVGIALWLDDVIEARRAADEDGGDDARARAGFALAPALPLAALFGAAAAVVLGKDLKSFAEELCSLHVLGAQVAYPKDLIDREVLPYLGMLFGVPLGLGLWLYRPSGPRWPRSALVLAPAVLLLTAYVVLAGFVLVLMIADVEVKALLALAGLVLLAAPLSLLLLRPGERTELFAFMSRGLSRIGIPWAMGAALLSAFWLAHCWTPALSHKLSSKELFAAYHRYRESGDRLGVMGTAGNGPKYYAGGTFTRIDNRTDLVAFLADPRRSFALMPAGELCPLHKAAKGKFDYAVLDDSNAQFLLVANKPGGTLPDGAEDQNPLARSILRAVPPGLGDKVLASFDDKVDLIGVDLPRSVSRGSVFDMTLYFRVNKPVGANWKIFVHFDGGGLRFQGDHDPIQGRCGTNYWQEGDIVVDTFAVEAGDMSYEKTAYTARIGFFQGSHGSWKNMKVTRGPKDDNDRVSVGTIQVN